MDSNTASRTDRGRLFGASASSLQNDAALRSHGDPKDAAVKARRHSSECKSWLAYDALATPSSTSSFVDQSFEGPSDISIVISDECPQNSSLPSEAGSLLNFSCLLDELELLACQIKSLPVPTPPLPSLAALADALTLPMDISIPSIDVVSGLVVYLYVDLLC